MAPRAYGRPNDPTRTPASLYIAIAVGAALVAGALFVLLSRGDGGSGRASELLAARGDSLLNALQSSRAEGDFAGALAAAEELAGGAAFAGTAWADSGSALLQPLRDTLAVEESLGVSRAKWAYNRSTDLETSINVYHAMIESENLVNLAAPYDGEQRGQLYFRTHPRYGRQIYLQLERGSLVCPTIGGCTVGVQFDDEPQIQWEATRVGDLSPQMVFLVEHDAFVQRVMDAGTLRIQPTAFPDEHPVFDFEVSGFEYDLYSTEPLSAGP